jgi:hypothetical protein
MILSGMAFFFLVGMLGQCANAMALVLGLLNGKPIRTGNVPTDVTQCA